MSKYFGQIMTTTIVRIIKLLVEWVFPVVMAIGIIVTFHLTFTQGLVIAFTVGLIYSLLIEIAKEVTK